MRTLKLILLTIALAFGMVGCTSGSDAVAEQIESARDAVAAERYDEAQTICDNLTRNGLDGMTETTLGRLAIIYMQLSDHAHYDENAAVATECMREALKVSTDSLAAFSRSLTPAEQVPFALVRRIAGGIDNPIDLMSADIAGEDGLVNDCGHAADSIDGPHIH